MSYPPQPQQGPYGSPNPYEQSGSSPYGGQPDYSSPTPPDYGATPSAPASGAGPYGSQPYSSPPAQPYSGQPYGEQAYPASGGPGYPTAGQPDPYAPGQYPPAGQPYGEQPYGYAPGQQYPVGPGGQPYPGAPQPSGKSKGLVVGIVVGVLALLCAGAGVAVVASGALDGTPKAKASSSAGTDSSADPGSSRSAGSSPTAAAKQVKLVAPDQIGSLTKSSDQSDAEDQRKQMVDSGYENAFAAEYEDSSNRLVLLWGATGKAFGSSKDQSRLDELFDGARNELDNATIGTRVPSSPGSAGGSLECAPLNGLGITATMCGWVGQNALLVIVFRGFDVTKSGAQSTTILSAVVTKE